MSRRRKGGDEEEFNSFIDIMTCLAGILMLIILLVIVQVQEVRVVIPTPMVRVSGKAPVYVECRSNMLYRVDLPRIKERVETVMSDLRDVSEKDGQLDKTRFLRELGMAKVEEGPYLIDLSYYLAGQFAVRPNPDVQGYELTSVEEEITRGGWYRDLLRAMNSKQEILAFIVRDDSFEVFRKARSIAWVEKVDASWELQPHNEPIKFGLGGTAIMQQ